jgi:hypothetical protein
MKLKKSGLAEGVQTMKNVFRKTKVYSLVLTIVWFLVLEGTGQTVTYKIPTDEEFDAIFDIIFPKKTTSYDPNVHEFAFDIRVEPSFNSPSQLSVTKSRNGSFEILRYELADKKRPIFEQLISLPAYSETKDFAVLAKQLSVERRQPSNLKVVKRNIEGLFHNLSFRKETNFVLDGVMYKLWYVDTGSKFQFAQISQETYVLGESRLVTILRKTLDASRE